MTVSEKGAIKHSKENDFRKYYFCEGLGRSEVNNKNYGKTIATTFIECILRELKCVKGRYLVA